MSADAEPGAGPRLVLVIGGARSGKSRHAEALVEAMAPPWTYVATAQAFDAEMAERIVLHQTRRDDSWRTIEAPTDLAGALRRAEGPVLVDCLTLWLSNLMLAGTDPGPAIEDVEAAVASRRQSTVIVTNEVGLGIVPDNALARRFRDEQGRLNQRFAAQADHVVMMVAGIPMVIK
jgi:adenosylcobinamide kinase/adenosylcobinamide-phosphate guanylyltransferase